MGLKNFLSSTIMRMDFLCTSASFRTRKQPYYETIAGGSLSLVIMGFFIYFLYSQMSSMLQNLSIEYTQAIDDNVGSSSVISSFPVAVSIKDVNLAGSPKKFQIELKQIVITGGVTTVKTPLVLSPCETSD